MDKTNQEKELQIQAVDSQNDEDVGAEDGRG